MRRSKATTLSPQTASPQASDRDLRTEETPPPKHKMQFLHTLVSGNPERWTSVVQAGGRYAVYIMASRRNGTLYVGVTNNLASRVHQHRTGEGASSLASTV